MMPPSVLRIALLGVSLCASDATLLSCAHGSDTGAPALSTIDTRTDDARKGSLAFAVGKVTVVDLCAAWLDDCLINAKAIDEACEVLCPEDVEMVTILLDELGPQAVKSYRDVLKVRQRVLLPGPTLQAGESALGEIDSIPRIIVFDRQGRIAIDIAGGSISPVGLIREVRALQ